MGSQTGEEEEEEGKGEGEGEGREGGRESKGQIAGGRRSWTCSQERLSGDLGYSESHEFPRSILGTYFFLVTAITFALDLMKL